MHPDDKYFLVIGSIEDADPPAFRETSCRPPEKIMIQLFIAKMLERQKGLFDEGNRILNDGTYAVLYDGNGNLTRRTTLVSGAPTGAFVQYSWDHRNQLTKVEFYNALVNSRSSLPRRTFAARRTQGRTSAQRRRVVL